MLKCNKWSGALLNGFIISYSKLSKASQQGGEMKSFGVQNKQ